MMNDTEIPLLEETHSSCSLKISVLSQDIYGMSWVGHRKVRPERRFMKVITRTTVVWGGFCKRVLPEVESKVYRQAKLRNTCSMLALPCNPHWMGSSGIAPV